MPSQDFEVRYLKPDGTWEPLNIKVAELSPVAYIQPGNIDWAAPQGDVSVSICGWFRPLSRAEMQDLAHRARDFRPRKHVCSALTSRLRAQFPRLTTAQIDRLAQVIRRKRGRPITSMRALVKRLSRKELVQMGNRMWRGAP